MFISRTRRKCNSLKFAKDLMKKVNVFRLCLSTFNFLFKHTKFSHLNFFIPDPLVLDNSSRFAVMRENMKII